MIKSQILIMQLTHMQNVLHQSYLYIWTIIFHLSNLQIPLMWVGDSVIHILIATNCYQALCCLWGMCSYTLVTMATIVTELLVLH